MYDSNNNNWIIQLNQKHSLNKYLNKSQYTNNEGPFNLKKNWSLKLLIISWLIVVNLTISLQGFVCKYIVTFVSTVFYQDLISAHA